MKVKHIYYGWMLDQHPASLLQQLGNQNKEGDNFISSFVWNKKFKQFLSKNIKSSQFPLWEFTKNGKTITLPMIQNGVVVNPVGDVADFFLQKQGKKQKYKKLEIMRRAYAGTEKQKEIEEEIEEIEQKEEMSIGELVLQ